MFLCRPTGKHLTTKLAPIRSDPVPEMVWTVMLCLETRTAASSWTKSIRMVLSSIYFSVLTPPTYPGTFQHFIISAKSQLGTGLGEFTKTPNGKVLLVQLFGCNDRLCLPKKVKIYKFKTYIY